MSPSSVGADDDGALLGIEEGLLDGLLDDGTAVGRPDGCVVGAVDGCIDGIIVG